MLPTLQPSSDAVPTLNLSHFLQGDAQQLAFIEQLGRALENTGFFILEQPGIDPGIVQAAYDAAAEFFQLSDSTKRTYENAQLKGQGGFTAFGREHAKDSPLPDLKEFWHVNRHSLSTADGWPQVVPGFRPAMRVLYQQLDRCAAWLLEACALYLSQPRPWLREMVENGRTILRIAHYPPITGEVPAGSLRAAPHEDINFITLLCAATQPGLEIRDRTGAWLPVQAQPGQLVVDTGDMLQNLTNGLFKSTTHRVVNSDRAAEPRLSMPFFVHPRPEVDLSPHPDCIYRTGGQAQYPTMNAETYLHQRLQEIGLG